MGANTVGAATLISVGAVTLISVGLLSSVTPGLQPCYDLAATSKCWNHGKIVG